MAKDDRDVLFGAVDTSLLHTLSRCVFAKSQPVRAVVSGDIARLGLLSRRCT
eukprot:CAMPEP_0198545600 /NCGR_PEP_ID=MMETSP1462-20131121/64630_1 /TAXON_ID=1333877 /ORGANISM="Brandtodinium nutriculum, Strain RCC3387" /LENGTH=51 /DNA_ID=CAMNT_0044275985 /DNA_START=30 /DNA_END=182 /DNA_ORIENTATION=-